MISFEGINKRSIKYELLYRYIQFAHNLIFYKKYKIVGKKNIPKNLPVVAICNHQNGLNDALGVLFSFSKDGRRPVFIARSDIFRKTLWAKLLKFLKIMPAFRASDELNVGELSDNEKIFDVSADVLAKDSGVVCIFPEAGHQDKRFLGSFKKGFARIAFRAAQKTNFEKPIYILPIGNHYSNYFSFRSKLLINIGEPFEFSELYPIYKNHPEKAQKMLTDKARTEVEKLMLNISNLKHYEEYEMLCKMYSKDAEKRRKNGTKNFEDDLKLSQRAVESVENLKAKDYKAFELLMQKTFRYIRNIEKLGLRDWIFRQDLTIAGTLWRLLLVIMLFPFFAVSLAVNIIPFNTSTLITRKIEDQMLHSSFHMIAGILFIFPIWYLISFVIITIFTKWWIALVCVAIMPFSLILYFKGKILWLKLFNRIRRFQLWFKGNNRYTESIELRKEIVEDMNKLVV